MEKPIRMTVEHKDIELYNERYEIYPLIHVLSFMSPEQAMIYNNVVNFDHWISSNDQDAQLAIMRICTPKTRYSYNKVWGKFVKKPKVVTPKNEKELKWLMIAFEVSREIAKSYLEVEGVLEEVKDRMKGII